MKQVVSQSEAILFTRNLTKHFGALTAINGVNISVGPGVHSIIGPNGAGKTTLFNLLTGFLTPDDGYVSYRGEKISGLPPYAISRRGVARSFQITSIFAELSVFENVRVAVQSRLKASYNFLISHRSLKDVERKTIAILRQVGLEDWANSTAKNLPYGLQRCLDIGISLATDPQLVLLDEPTSGVSREDTTNILDLITAISRALPVVLIEHNIDIVLSVSDMITVLYQGVVLAEGPPALIRDDEKVQEAYLGGY